MTHQRRNSIHAIGILIIASLPCFLSAYSWRIAFLPVSWTAAYMLWLRREHRIIAQFQRVYEAAETEHERTLRSAAGSAHIQARTWAGAAPVLIGQLSDVMRQTEDAVMDLFTRFTGIAERTRNQSEKAVDAFREFNGQEQGNGLLDVSRRTFQSVIGGLNDISQATRDTLHLIEETARNLAHIRSIVADIDYIAKQTNLLAFNAAIEAARAGEAGNGFAVVAGEVRALSEKSNAAAGQISKLISSVEDDLHSVAAMADKSSTLSTTLSTSAGHDVDRTMEVIEAMVNRTRTVIEEMTGETTSLAQEINGVLMSMQFQDITRQRIEHVIEPIRKFQLDAERLVGELARITGAHAAPIHQHDFSWIENLYTMESERATLRNNMSNESSTAETR